MQEKALFAISNGLYVLSAKDGDGWAGSLVDAVSQVCAAPCLIMVSCMNTGRTKECIEKSGEFSLSVLPRGVDPFVIANFGYQSSRDVQKWNNVPKAEINGLMYLPDALAKIRARVVNKLVYAGSTVFIAEVVDAFDAKDGEPLTYKEYRDGLKEQVTAAFKAYKAGQAAGKASCPAPEKRWTCKVCGYAYDGDVPFEKLPDDWRCPLCGVGKDMFELQ